jgi:regulator of nucleoside diphosphate kinase
MAERDIFITEFDMRRLGELLQVALAFGKPERNYLKELNAELNRAQIVKPQEIPPDVVTMNSEVRLRESASGKEATYKLVFPAGANAEKRHISILAPLGTALLGYRRGDTLEWTGPEGTKHAEIVEVLFQPEAAGRFDL